MSIRMLGMIDLRPTSDAISFRSIKKEDVAADIKKAEDTKITAKTVDTDKGPKFKAKGSEPEKAVFDQEDEKYEDVKESTSYSDVIKKYRSKLSEYGDDFDGDAEDERNQQHADASEDDWKHQEKEDEKGDSTWAHTNDHRSEGTELPMFREMIKSTERALGLTESPKVTRSDLKRLVKEEYNKILEDSKKEAPKIAKKLQEIHKGIFKDTLKNVKLGEGSEPARERRIQLITVSEMIDVPVNELIMYFLNNVKTQNERQLIEYHLGHIYFRAC